MAVTVIRVGVMAGSSPDFDFHHIQVGGSWFVEDTPLPRDGERGTE